MGMGVGIWVWEGVWVWIWVWVSVRVRRRWGHMAYGCGFNTKVQYKKVGLIHKCSIV
jgi:hypothetical protein